MKEEVDKAYDIGYEKGTTMTNYNERLDKILVDNFEEIRVIGCTVESMDRRIVDAKQAIISLTKELVAEAKPVRKLPESGDSVAVYYEKMLAEFEQNLLKELEEV